MNVRRNRGLRSLLALLALTFLAGVLAACGSDGDGGAKSEGGSESTTGTDGDGESGFERGGEPGTVEGALRVPDDFDTIQAAVDAAEPGDLILIDEGVYEEAVDVETDHITIRGLDRNEVILDGGFELENGIRVLDAEGVVVENMTARNYVTNGFFWTGSDYYRGSYLTAYRNGDYGVYAFDSYHGQFDNSLGSGSPDAGFYIGQCFECDAVIDNVISEYNGLGYSGTNSGGEVYIVNSTFRYNRVGIAPNSGSYELCYPSRSNTIVGNTVYDNNNTDAPAIDVALLAHGNGILLPGAVDNVVERNLVYDHDRTGIGAVPFPEEDASDVPPPVEDHDKPCDEVRDQELPDPDTIPELVLWHPTGNVIRDNVVSGSGLGDLASATIDLDGTATEDLDNCFSSNTFETSAPANIETLAPCDGDGEGDWSDGALDLLVLITELADEPPADSYQKMPEPGDQPNMPDADTAPAVRYEGPTKPDLDAIEVPSRPEE